MSTRGRGVGVEDDHSGQRLAVSGCTSRGQEVRAEAEGGSSEGLMRGGVIGSTYNLLLWCIH